MTGHGETPAGASRPPWSELRQRLSASGFRPSRRLGQNFVLDQNLLRAIVADAHLPSGAAVLEVGPGLGFLSGHLLASGVDLVAIEVDPRLAELCRELCGDEPRLRLVVADALAGKSALSPALEAALAAEPLGDRPWHLVSNLPYAIAAPLLALLCERESPPASLTVLVQREVAERLVARPGEADWGPLALRLSLGWTPRIVRHVPPDLFWPRPKVESAVVHAVLRPDARPRAERAALVELARALFHQPRQTVRRTLSAWAGGRERALALLAAAGLDGGERPVQLDAEDLERLVRAAHENPSGGA